MIGGDRRHQFHRLRLQSRARNEVVQQPDAIRFLTLNRLIFACCKSGYLFRKPLLKLNQVM
jgi:hypothetical protein